MQRRPCGAENPHGGGALRRRFGPRPGRRQVFGHAGRRHLLAPPQRSRSGSRTRAARSAATRRRRGLGPALVGDAAAARPAAAPSPAPAGRPIAACSATCRTSCPTCSSPARPGGCARAWNYRRWCAGCGCTCTIASTCGCSGRTLDRQAACRNTSSSTAASRTSGTRASASRTGGANRSASARRCASRPARSTHDAVNPAAVDALKVQPLGMIEVRILRRIWLSGGYGITFMRARGRDQLRVQSRIRQRCFDSGGNLATDACQARLAGRARPTANGRYTATRRTSASR